MPTSHRLIPELSQARHTNPSQDSERDVEPVPDREVHAFIEAPRFCEFFSDVVHESLRPISRMMSAISDSKQACSRLSCAILSEAGFRVQFSGPHRNFPLAR